MHYTQCVEGEVFMVQGEQTSNSDFDPSFLDEKSNLNRLGSNVTYPCHNLYCSLLLENVCL